MTGNKLVDNIIVGLLTLASAGTLAVFVYTTMIYKKPVANNNALQKQLIEDSKKDISLSSYKLDKMIINLYSRQSKLRFLDIEIYLHPLKAKHIEIFEKNKPIIYDTINDIVGNMKANTLNSLYGKVLLTTRIKKRLNQSFNQVAVKDIYFSKFTIQ